MASYQVTVAPNGARRVHAYHAKLPVTIDEIASAASECQVAGAQNIHLHVRDATGQHSLDAGRYREAIAAVEAAAPGLAIQITTESAGVYDVAEQVACLQALRPVAASIALREMAHDPVMAARAYAICTEAATKVQHIIYDPSDIDLLNHWYQDGTVPTQMRDVIFVLGKYQQQVLSQPGDLQAFLAATTNMRFNWSVCAFGRNEHACLLAAIAAGGDVRVGFENNIEFPDGSPLPDNATSVATLIKAAAQAGHSLKEV